MGSSFEITARVTDTFGQTAQTAFTLTVVEDAVDPLVAVTYAPLAPVINQPVTFSITAVDNVALAANSLSITVNGLPLAVTGGNTATFTPTTAGPVTVVATAIDASGNIGTESFDLFIVDPSDVLAPTVTITSPAPGGQQITAPTDIIGSVTDDNLHEYIIDLRSVDGGPWQTIHTGNSNVTNNVLGQLDPTLLANGSYVLRVTATDLNGRVSEDSRMIEVAGNLKLGNFRLSFTDLSLPLGGIPITISRTYDTLNANSGGQGEFGYGWNLDLFDMNIGVDLDPSDPSATLEANDLAEIGIYSPYRDGTRLHVRLPDGTRESFTVIPQTLQGLGGGFLSGLLNLYQMKIVPDANTFGSLAFTINPQVIRNGYGEYTTADGVPFNPASPLLGIDFIYQSPDGVKYTISGDSGKVTTIQDRVGNNLRITDAGVKSIAPDGTLVAEIAFTRDHKGRIISVTDPAGKSITYSYDNITGDLVSVTDRVGAVTTLKYDVPGNPHFLSKITNDLGQDAMALQYDSETGRIISLGVPGASLPLSYNLDLGDGRFAEHIADAKGVPSILVRDTCGNLVRRIQRVADDVDPASRKFLVTVWQFDADDNTTHQSDTFEVTGEANIYDAQPPYWRFVRTFDALGNVLTDTNVLGLTTYSTYDGQGNLLTRTDPAGNTTRSEYDAQGKLVRSTDAAGVTTTYEYDAAGNQIAIRNSLGIVVSTSTYDSAGRLTSSHYAGGTTTYFAYDQNGNQTRSWQLVTTDEGAFEVIQQTTYDSAGRIVGSAQIINDGSGERVLSSSSTTYNSLGQETQTTDELGLRTQYIYDYRGQLIETRRETRQPDGSAAWQLSRTVYDDNGQTIFSTDTFLEGDSPYRGYATLFDDQGRTVGSETYSGPTVNLVEHPDGLHAELASTGTLISSSSTSYDPIGRVVASVNHFGTQTQHVYDQAGRTVQTRTQARDANDQLVWVTTETVYDALGRVLISTQQHVDGSAEGAVATRSIYDLLGRVVRTERLHGVEIQIEVDPVTGLATSHVADEGVVVSSSESRFDSLGRVFESVDARGGVTTYEYDELGRSVATIAPAEYVVGYDAPVRQRTETIYDDQGRASQTLSRIVVLPDGTQDRSHLLITSMIYNERGQVVQVNLPDGTSTRTEYDDLGRTVAEIDQVGRVKRYEYASASASGAGNLAAVILPELSETALPGTPETTGVPRYEYEYDTRGNHVLTRDALGRETTYTYDDQGRQLTRTLPLGQTEFWEYDQLGREMLHTSFEGVVTRSVYDDRPGSNGRLIAREFYASRQSYEDTLAGVPGARPGEIWTYSYSALGQLVQIVQDRDGNLATTADARPEDRAYDIDRRLSLIATPEGIINYEYDLATGDHIATWTGTDQADPITEIIYGYDTRGRLITVSNTARFGDELPNPETTTYAYDLSGALALQIYSNGVISEYTNDVLGRTLNLTQTSPDGVMLASYSYTLDLDGRRLAALETQLTDQDAGTYATTAIRWTYDNAGRLAREEHDFNVADVTSFDWQTEFDADRQVDYILDLVGNRLWQVSDLDGDGLTDEQIEFTYDANDRLLVEYGRIVESVVTHAQYFWGTAGSDIVIGAGVGTATYQTGLIRYEHDNPDHVLERIEYTYNLQDRLVHAKLQREQDGQQVATEVEYQYNQEGIRFFKAESVSVDGEPATTTTTQYLVDPNNPTGYQQTLEETTTTTQPDGSSETVATVNVAGYSILAQIDNAGNLHVLLPDALGSTRLVLDAVARIAQAMIYDAFGVKINIQATSGNQLTLYQYRGEYFDSQTHMYYLRARYFTPANGRMLTIDPAPFISHLPGHSHVYTYVGGDPLTLFDPTGRSPLLNLLIISGIALFLAGCSIQGTAVSAENMRASVRTISVRQLVRIPYVRDGIEVAWRRSNPYGAYHERREQGFSIINDTRNRNLVLFWWPEGEPQSIRIPELGISTGSHLKRLADFHTHPNPASENFDEGPSNADLVVASIAKIPQIIKSHKKLHFYGVSSQLVIAYDPR